MVKFCKDPYGKHVFGKNTAQVTNSSLGKASQLTSSTQVSLPENCSDTEAPATGDYVNKGMKPKLTKNGSLASIIEE